MSTENDKDREINMLRNMLSDTESREKDLQEDWRKLRDDKHRIKKELNNLTIKLTNLLNSI